METAISQEDMIEIFDQVTREIIQRDAGIRLCLGDAEPTGELCTVYAAFNKGYYAGLSLCAETFMFNRLARHVMQEEEITPQDVEDAVKEFFNVLCGHIVSRMFQKTRIPGRFSIPTFHWGRYDPKNCLQNFSLTYVSDDDEHAQVIHYAPFKEEQLCQDEQKEGVL